MLDDTRWPDDQEFGERLYTIFIDVKTLEERNIHPIFHSHQNGRHVIGARISNGRAKERI